MLTPSALFVTSFISYSRIVDKTDKVYKKKFGSLFSEFKNDRGFLSTQYYVVFFIRRLVYLITQVYLNTYPFVQAGVNIALSIVHLFYLIYYRPFKERPVFVSCIVGDIGVLVVLCLSTFYLGNITQQLSYILETVCIFTVMGCMGIQMIISTYSLFISFRNIIRKIMKYRALAFVDNYEKTFNNSVNADNTTHTDILEVTRSKLGVSPKIYNIS